MDYVRTEAKTPLDLEMCKRVAEYLTPVYPGHSWYVEINDGMLIIKSFKISGNAAMVVSMRHFDGDAERLKREVVMKAGEFLEAANLRRGAFQGDNATTLEGLPNGQKASLIKQPTTYTPDNVIDVGTAY